MEVGDVRIAEDADFAQVKDLCTCHDGWKQDYNKNGTLVWTKANDVSDFKMIKVFSTFKDISATTLYDVLHDPGYRKVWDGNMLDSYDICCLSPNNDIGYYAMKTPKPLKNRDFVTQRSWLDRGTEFYIINHSVNHKSVPPKKNCVRGISYVTGYYLVPVEGIKCNEPGVTISYVTQSDPKGKLPAWCVNKLTQWFAPKVISRIHKAARGYLAWKQKHNPHLKPWSNPEQMTLVRINMADIKSIQELRQAAEIDETVIAEDEVKDDDLREFTAEENGSS